MGIFDGSPPELKRLDELGKRRRVVSLIIISSISAKAPVISFRTIPLQINFDLREIRKHGIELLLVVLFFMMQISCSAGDLRRCRMMRRSRTVVERISEDDIPGQ